MSRFLPSLLTISFALSLGALIGTLFRRYAKDQEQLSRLRIRIQTLSLLILNPICFTGAVWILPLEKGALALLPAVCVFSIAGSFCVGLLAMRIKPLPTPGQRITFPLSCSFTNTGNMGGLIVFLLMGELAFSLVPFYKLLEEFWIYGVLFPYARQRAIQSGLIQDTGFQKSAFLRIVSDPFFMVVAVSLLLGLALNLLGVERPQVYGDINSYLIPTSAFFLLTAVGTQIRIGRIPLYWKPSLAILAIRIITIPFLAVGATLLLGFGSGDLMILKTVTILAMMPMAFMSMVPASLYNLDSDLTSTAWIFTTASLIISVPLLSFILA